MFSPAWWPRPQLRSTFGPLVWVREPCAAMRTALLRATPARQELQLRGPRPFRARSWLMSACWVDPITMAGGAGRGAGTPGAAAARATAGGGVGLGSGFGRGIIRWGAGSFALTPLSMSSATGLLVGVSE